MRTLTLFFLVLFSMVYGISLHAEEKEEAKIVQAATLNDRGEFRSTVLLLEPLLQPNANALATGETGVAWNLLGTAYQFLGEYDKARRSFEAAIRLLKDNEAQVDQYAVALNNLGSLDSEEGQAESSRILRLKAKQLYSSVGNHSGVARVANNLALVSVRQGRYKDARHSIAEAFREAGLAPQPNIDDLAAMYSIQCLIAGHDRDWPAALAAIQHAIDLWEPGHGSRYFLLAGAYALRAQIYAKLGQYQRAQSDSQNALARFEKTPGIDSPLYLEAELVYARILRDSGSKKEASSIEDKAKASLEELRRQQCTGCSVSLPSFH
jgi:tetratricopeptide (TPR) repeat protein